MANDHSTNPFRDEQAWDENSLLEADEMGVGDGPPWCMEDLARHNLLNSGRVLKEAHHGNSKSPEQIAKEIGCQPSLVFFALHYHGVQLNCRGDMIFWDRHERERFLQILANDDWLCEQLIRGNTAEDIADELLCPVGDVRAAISRVGYSDPNCRCRQFEWPIGKNGMIHPGVRRQDGYIFVRCPTHRMAIKSGYIAEHRLVAERGLGRLVKPSERVHHVNGCRDDNRLENLIVTPSYQIHMLLHKKQPMWVPCCGLCGRRRPELVLARPSWVPLLYDPVLTYLAEAPKE